MKKLTLLLLFPISVQAQNLLTADDALKTGLRNNYDIIVARNEAEADSILNAAGEAGMLPSVSANGTIGINRNNIQQKYANGNEFSASNAGSNSLSGSVQLSWTLFDGTRMFVVKERLSVVQMQGEYLFRSQVLNTSSAILLAYYDIVRQQMKLQAIDEIIRVNEERLKISNTRISSGTGAKTDLNQAKIDLNLQKENHLVQEEAVAASKRKLNQLLARELNTAFAVTDSIPEGPLPDRTQLEQKMYASNPDLLIFRTQVDISRLSLREARTQYSPRLSAQAGYNFNRNENTAGFSLYNQSYGWQTGLTLSVPVYQAGKNRRQVAISALNLESAESQLAKANLEAGLQMQNSLSHYDIQMKILALEKEIVAIARENMQLSLERLRLGEGSALEVQQAQITLANALARLADFRYELRAADIGLHRLAADL